MNSNDEDRAFLDTVKSTLDQQHDAIDEPTRAALRNIRHQAINHVRTGPARPWVQPLLYPALTAIATIAVVVSVMLTMNLNGTLSDLPTFDDIPLMTATDDIIFYQDLEFYQWLDTENING
jgi:hypothetical protein